jgi:uncharacterized protein (DUF433 family)
MILPDFLTQDEFGSIQLTGYRIDLAHLLYFYNEGFSPEMLWSEYPSLPLALIHKTIGFYLENQKDVDVYLAQFQSSAEENRAQSFRGPNIKELRQRLESMRTAQGA